MMHLNGFFEGTYGIQLFENSQPFEGTEVIYHFIKSIKVKKILFHTSYVSCPSTSEQFDQYIPFGIYKFY